MAVSGQPSMHGFRLFLLFIAWHFETPLHLARERETFWYLFRLCTPYGSRVSLTGEEEEEEEEEEERRRRRFSIFSKFVYSVSVQLS